MQVGDTLGGLAPQAVHIPELCRVGAVIEDVVQTQPYAPAFGEGEPHVAVPLRGRRVPGLHSLSAQKKLAFLKGLADALVCSPAPRWPLFHAKTPLLANGFAVSRLPPQ